MALLSLLPRPITREEASRGWIEPLMAHQAQLNWVLGPEGRRGFRTMQARAEEVARLVGLEAAREDHEGIEAVLWEGSDPYLRTALEEALGLHRIEVRKV